MRRSVTISTRLSPSRRASYAISSMAPSPNLIGEASITNTVSVGRVTPFIGFLSPITAPRPAGPQPRDDLRRTQPSYHCASAGGAPAPRRPATHSTRPDYNRPGESIAAPRPWPPAGHEVRGASAPRLPSLLRPRPSQRDRRQHRARHQLLGHLPGVPFADARGVCRHQPLGALPALLGLRGRPG